MQVEGGRATRRRRRSSSARMLARTATGKLQKFKLRAAVLGGPRPPGQLSVAGSSAERLRLGSDVADAMPAPRCDVVDLLHGWYPPETADDWDAVGLVPATPTPTVRTVLLAVDPALAGGPRGGRVGRRPAGRPTTRCSSRGVHGVAATTPKGRTLATLTARRLRAAHRAHQRRPGRRRRLRGAGRGARAARPRARSRRSRHRRSTSSSSTSRRPTPTRSARRWPRRAPGRIGDYDSRVVHRRRARAGSARSTGAAPDDRRGRRARGGRRGRGSRRCSPRAPRPRSCAAMLAAHPYEEPAYDVVELADPGDRARPAPAGSATVDETTLREFAEHGRGRAAGDRARRAGRRRPATAPYAGSRCAAEPATSCSTTVLRSDADVYVTSDLRHHPAAEFLEQGGPGAGRRRALGGRVDLAARCWRRGWREALGDTVETRVSTTCTDPWTFRRSTTSDLQTEEHALKADPSAQLKLLDVQELDSRADQLRHQLRDAARARRARRARRAGAASSTTRPATPGSPSTTSTAEQTQGRRRRRAGQDPPRARPAAGWTRG